MLALVAVLLAAQAPTSGLTLSNDVVEAEKTCEWDEYSEKWTCEKRRLDAFRLVGQASSEGTTTATIRVSPVADGTCIRAVHVEIADHPSELQVDWSRVVFSVNGTVAQAAPGFARQQVMSLAQRPSVVPVGTVLREDVLPVDAACIGKKRPPYEGVSMLELHLPHTIGGEAATFQWKLDRQWVAASEREVFSFLEQPPKVIAGTGFRPPLTVCCTLWGPGTWLGIATACLLGGAGIELVYAIVANGGKFEGASGGFLGAAACLVCVGVVPAFVSAVAGALADIVLLFANIESRASYDRRQKQASKYQAWVKKRTDLGLETSIDD